jgi:ABC-type branched-subunit amino acid transport system permease subunit
MKLRTEAGLAIAALALAPAGWVGPEWLPFLLMIACAKALVVAGVALQMRAGLVSFGQALYYCVGGYAAGLASRHLGISDAFALLGIGVLVSVAIAALCGLMVARYREIFYAMLSMALSMILYGVLVKSTVLGSTDGFNVPSPSYLGFVPEPAHAKRDAFLLTLGVGLCAALLCHRMMRSRFGRLTEALRENEIRVDFLGVSPFSLVYLNYLFAAALSALGGGLVAVATGHVDPEMAFWATSGEFVFMALLGGTAHIAAPFIAAFVFSTVRTFAIQEMPNVWQMTLGSVLLVVILFLPRGLWSVLAWPSARRRSGPRAGEASA